MDLRDFAQLAVKIAGLFMIVISLNSLPGRLVTLVGTHLPAGIQSLLGSFLFVPALISLAVGATLAFKADAVVGRVFKGDAPPSDNARAFEETAIFLMGLFIALNTAFELGFHLFNYGFAHFQKPGGSYLVDPIDYGVVFAFSLRLLMALALVLGANNLSRLHRRILTYRPMKDLRDV